MLYNIFLPIVRENYSCGVPVNRRIFSGLLVIHQRLTVVHVSKNDWPKRDPKDSVFLAFLSARAPLMRFFVGAIVVANFLMFSFSKGN